MTPSDQEALGRVLDRVADDLLWEAAVDRPPVNAFRVAQRLGLRVVRNARIEERGRFVRHGHAWAGSVIVGAEARPERRHWAVAHEIGEAFAHRVHDSAGDEFDPAEPGVREQLANALAGRLLAPRRWLEGVYRDLGGDLIETKRVFATASHELIARRLLETLGQGLIVTVFDHYCVSWRRGGGYDRPPALLPAERLAQRRAHRTGRVVEIIDDLTVRAWPVHEPGWKREIAICAPRYDVIDAWDQHAASGGWRHVG
ncbi:MAG: ImmA/IrrE family metallo-endopeptidase [Planctomycetota bacterium]